MKSPITIDFSEGTIIVNAAYAKKASNPLIISLSIVQMKTLKFRCGEDIQGT